MNQKILHTWCIHCKPKWEGRKVGRGQLILMLAQKTRNALGFFQEKREIFLFIFYFFIKSQNDEKNESSKIIFSSSKENARPVKEVTTLLAICFLKAKYCCS